jgi:putative ABC transport system permease protein
MRFLPLVWRNLMRRKTRTILTLLVIVVIFVLYAYLAAITAGFSAGVDLAGSDRLVLTHKVSLIQLLPESYGPRIAGVAGVTEVCHNTWFGGIYQSAMNFFPQIAVEPDCLLRMYPEYLLPDAQKKAWLGDRMGAIVGRSTATRFGWTVGQRVPIQLTIWRRKDGKPTYEFRIDGIYDGVAKGTDTTNLFFHYKYLDESRMFGQGMVGWYVIRIGAPANAPAIAQQIDDRFANSPFETKTTTEKAFAQAFVNQIGDIGAIMRAVLGAAFFTLLLVTANTMAQSVRERTNELAVLKTLGFSDGRVLGLVLLESCLLAVVGGGLGLGLAWLAITRGGDPTGGLIPGFILTPRALLVGASLVLALGLVAGVFPALRARRLQIADALRRS